jgi:hypothetical protein
MAGGTEELVLEVDCACGSPIDFWCFRDTKFLVRHVGTNITVASVYESVPARTTANDLMQAIDTQLTWLGEEHRAAWAVRNE